MNSIKRCSRNDFIVILVIPVVLCLLIPYIMYGISTKLEVYIFKIDNVKIYIYMVMKYFCYFLVAISLYTLYSLKYEQLKGLYNYLIGFIIIIFIIISICIINYKIYMSAPTEVIVSIAFFNYCFKIVEMSLLHLKTRKN